MYFKDSLYADSYYVHYIKSNVINTVNWTYWPLTVLVEQPPFSRLFAENGKRKKKSLCDSGHNGNQTEAFYLSLSLFLFQINVFMRIKKFSIKFNTTISLRSSGKNIFQRASKSPFDECSNSGRISCHFPSY